MKISIYEYVYSTGIVFSEKKLHEDPSIPVTKIEAEIPEGMYAGKNVYGDTIIRISGEEYLLNDMLHCVNGSPCIVYYNGFEERFIKLK